MMSELGDLYQEIIIDHSKQRNAFNENCKNSHRGRYCPALNVGVYT